MEILCIRIVIPAIHRQSSRPSRRPTPRDPSFLRSARSRRARGLRGLRDESSIGARANLRRRARLGPSPPRDATRRDATRRTFLSEFGLASVARRGVALETRANVRARRRSRGDDRDARVLRSRVATSRDAARKFSRRRRRRGRTRAASRARRRVARRVRIDVSSRRASTRTTVVSTLFAHRLRNVKRIDNRVDRDVARSALDDARDCPTRDVRDVRESSVGTKVRLVVARLFSSRRRASLLVASDAAMRARAGWTNERFERKSLRDANASRDESRRDRRARRVGVAAVERDASSSLTYPSRARCE